MSKYQDRRSLACQIELYRRRERNGEIMLRIAVWHDAELQKEKFRLAEAWGQDDEKMGLVQITVG